MTKRRLRSLAVLVPAVAAAALLLLAPAAAQATQARFDTDTAAATTAAAAPNPNTCTFWRAHHGPWGSTAAFVSRGLVWTATSNANHSQVKLAKNADKLTQCWKMLGGFGNGRFEFQLANSSLCLNVAGNSKAVGANIVLYPCLSQTNELFVGATNNLRTQFQSSSSGLCMEARFGAKAGALLVQDKCSHWGDWQSWFLK